MRFLQYTYHAPLGFDIRDFGFQHVWENLLEKFSAREIFLAGNLSAFDDQVNHWWNRV